MIADRSRDHALQGAEALHRRIYDDMLAEGWWLIPGVIAGGMIWSLLVRSLISWFTDRPDLKTALTGRRLCTATRYL
jgi:hypothetical protein